MIAHCYITSSIQWCAGRVCRSVCHHGLPQRPRRTAQEGNQPSPPPPSLSLSLSLCRIYPHYHLSLLWRTILILLHSVGNIVFATPVLRCSIKISTRSCFIYHNENKRVHEVVGTKLQACGKNLILHGQAFCGIFQELAFIKSPHTRLALQILYTQCATPCFVIVPIQCPSTAGRNCPSIVERVWRNQPLWPNGEGTGLLNQGLWVRVPPGVLPNA